MNMFLNFMLQLSPALPDAESPSSRQCTTSSPPGSPVRKSAVGGDGSATTFESLQQRPDSPSSPPRPQPNQRIPVVSETGNAPVNIPQQPRPTQAARVQQQSSFECSVFVLSQALLLLVCTCYGVYLALGDAKGSDDAESLVAEEDLVMDLICEVGGRTTLMKAGVAFMLGGLLNCKTFKIPVI